MILLLSCMCLRGTRVTGAEYLLSEKELPLTGPLGKPKGHFWKCSSSTASLYFGAQNVVHLFSFFYSQSQEKQKFKQKPRDFGLAHSYGVHQWGGEERKNWNHGRTGGVATTSVLISMPQAHPRSQTAPVHSTATLSRVSVRDGAANFQPGLREEVRREGRRTVTKRNQGAPRAVQPPCSCWHHRQVPGTWESPFQCWHRAPTRLALKHPVPAAGPPGTLLSRPFCQCAGALRCYLLSPG